MSERRGDMPGGGNFRNQYQNRNQHRNFYSNHNNNNNNGQKSFYSNGFADGRNININTERHHHEYHQYDYTNDETNTISNGYSSSRSSSAISGSRRLSLQSQGDLQNFSTLLRPFQNVNEKKSWPKHFKELATFFQTSLLMQNSATRERIFEETIQAFEKIFNNKLYKNTSEELVMCMAAFCDSLQGLQQDLFTWIFKIYFAPSTSEENKLIILRCLSTIMATSNIINADSYFYTQIKLKKALESTNNIEIFLQISQLMIATGKRSSNSLQPHVENLIDILLGWYMDGHQPTLILYLIEEILVSLDFKNHLQFSHLLSQFIEDVEKYYQELLFNFNNKNDHSSSLNKFANLQLHKMSLRVRVFAIFYRKIYLENYSKSICNLSKMMDMKNGYVFCMNSIRILMKVVLSLKFYQHMVIYEELLIECNYSIIVLVETLSTLFDSVVDFKPMETEFIQYCNMLLDLVDNASSQKLVITSMDFIQLYIKNLNNNLTQNFVDQLFDPKFQSLKFSLNKHVQQSFIALFYSLLKIKSVEILDRSYRHVLKSLKMSFDYLQTLQKHGKASFSAKETGEILQNLDSILYEPWNLIENEQECLISLYIDVILLAEIANTKHSLIAMLALSPNFIELMLYHLDLSNEWFTEHYSSIHYSLLYIFCSYCEKHHNFIAQSSLFTNMSSSTNQQHQISPLFDLGSSSSSCMMEKPNQIENIQSSLSPSNSYSSMRFTPNSHASNYFIDILKKLKSILSIKKLKANSILLCLRLVEDIVAYFTTSKTKVSIIMNLKEFIHLINIVSEYSFSNNYEVCKSTCSIIKNLMLLIDDSELDHYAQVLSNYRKACEFNLAHTNASIAELFLDLLASLPTFSGCSKAIRIIPKSINQAYNIQNEILLYPEEAHLTIVSLVNKQPSEHFSALAFQTIIDFIHNDNSSLNWLIRVFYLSIDDYRLKIPSTIRSTISYLPFISNNFDSMKVFQSNYWALMFWICYEFVQHCIENRLKTLLGKPQDTFTKIESMIKMFVNYMQNSRAKFDSDTMNTISQDTKHNTIRIHMLLMILDNFDKLIYNAIHGNSLRLYVPSKASKAFFKKNRATCSEWINRNRRSIMVLASKVAQPTIVIHHGQELLRNYQSDRNLFTLDEIEFILLLMIDSLIQLKAPETIMGYYIWAKECLNVKFIWIKAATDEANGRYEKALTEYQSLLKAKIDSKSTLDEQFNYQNQTTLNLVTSSKNFICNSYTVNFFRKRILNCLLNLEDYDSVVEWSNRTLNSSMAYSLFGSNVDYSYLKSLSTFTDLPSNEKFTSKINVDSQQHRGMFYDIESSYHQMQSNLFECVRKFFISDSPNGQKEFDDGFEDLVRNKLNPLISSFTMCGLSLDDHFVTLQRIAYQLRLIVSSDNKIQSSCKPNAFGSQLDTDLDVDLLVNSLSWHRVFCKLNNQKTNHVEQATMKNSLNNLMLKTASKARKTQNFQLAQDLLFQYAKSTLDPNLTNSYSQHQRHIDKQILLDIFQHSLTKPLFSQNLLDFCFETSKFLRANNDPEMAIEVMLKSINVFLGQKTSNSLESTSRMFLKLVQFIQLESYQCKNDEFEKLCAHEKFCLIDEKVSYIKNLSHSENICGKLLLLAVNNCPSLAKAWYQLADWSYRWGRRLSDNDEEKINVGGNELDREENVIEFYKLAANSYIKFLHISAHSGCNDVDATLRLLRLILKHAPELREILESGLKETPTKPWKNITLQLFSRLNHHELYVRQSVSELLCRIGSDSPHLVIFPAVTGLLDDQIKSKNFDYTSTKNDEDEEEDENSQSIIDQSLVRNCYASLLDTLSHRDLNLITQTKLFVHELRRITVLWDELWIGILQHNVNEVKRQIAALEKEIEKTKNNVNLYENEKTLFIKEQHNIFFRRILYSLKLTNMLTSDTPETPHEEWFQKNFNQSINLLIESINNPNNIYEPSNIIDNYQDLFQLIHKRSLSTNNYRFQMQDISPKLAQLENTVIPLPGLNGSNVTLKGVLKTVSVLHTYTKPKKIIFIGSDGRNYAYLFKGHEDLHLDERIMQFLSIVNKMIVKFGPSSAFSSSQIHKLFLRARHYSVTPLGNKSGLIQWVEGGHALYNLYKRWLSNREVSLEEINKRITANELFKSKLAEHGITSEIRNDWSLDVLKTVYLELVAETPNDLIFKELWCSSMNSYDHWNLTQNFITSNAIMSMIGYILGLGDRHLDNILLDLTTGEVIHIDYNICFEKGKTLRVPEMVLCRLTQNIINAFGITGVEGTFRISCENILKILRKGKETLLTLLEAFVYDPLIDWTPDHEEGFTGAIYGGAKIAQLAKEGKIIPKKQMEKENQNAIERLKGLMKLVEQRNTDWPKIDNIEAQQELHILAKNTTTDQTPVVSTSTSTLDSNVTRKNKRNFYAFSVWKRIKMKLDGRDPYVYKRLTTFEQVNYVIKESVNVKNLSRMFEGWASWV